MATSTSSRDPNYQKFGRSFANFISDPAVNNIGKGISPIRAVKSAAGGFHGMFGTVPGLAFTAGTMALTDISLPQLAFETTVGWSMMKGAMYMGGAGGRIAGQTVYMGARGAGRIAKGIGGRAAGRMGAGAAYGVGRGYEAVEKQLLKRGVETAGFRKAVSGGRMGAAGTARIGAAIGSGVLPIGGTLIGAAAGFIGGAMLSTAMYDAAISAPRKMMEYGRKLRELETGKGFHDPFGTAYTMRQRSLKEIQKSHLNARSALGNESYYNHIR